MCKWFSVAGEGFNGAETNCGIAHILLGHSIDEQLRHIDISSNINLLLVSFELCLFLSLRIHLRGNVQYSAIDNCQKHERVWTLKETMWTKSLECGVVNSAYWGRKTKQKTNTRMDGWLRSLLRFNGQNSLTRYKWNFYLTNCLKTYTDTWREKTGNRPFPSSSEPLYQDEVKCSVFDAEMTFYSHANKTHFHNRGWVLGLILKVRVLGTRRWPIIKYQAPKIGRALPLFLRACPVIGPSFTLRRSLVPG